MKIKSYLLLGLTNAGKISGRGRHGGASSHLIGRPKSGRKHEVWLSTVLKESLCGPRRNLQGWRGTNNNGQIQVYIHV